MIQPAGVADATAGFLRSLRCRWFDTMPLNEPIELMLFVENPIVDHHIGQIDRASLMAGLQRSG
jgi:hypothetical protein